MIDMILATKFRPERLKVTVDTMLGLATNPNTRMIIVADCDDYVTPVAAYDIINKYPGKVSLLINSFSSKGNVAALNSGVDLVTQKYLTYFADDSHLSCKGWDDLAVKLLEENPEYMCLNLRSNGQINKFNIYIDAEYAYTFVVNTEKFNKLGRFDLIYKRYFSDPDFFLQMIWNDELMMTSKDIIFNHIIENDYIVKHNDAFSPFEMDERTFKNKWNPRQDELIEKFNKIKNKWGKLV